jgi:hypothetical protein
MDLIDGIATCDQRRVRQRGAYGLLVVKGIIIMVFIIIIIIFTINNKNKHKNNTVTCQALWRHLPRGRWGLGTGSRLT